MITGQWSFFHCPVPSSQPCQFVLLRLANTRQVRSVVLHHLISSLEKGTFVFRVVSPVSVCSLPFSSLCSQHSSSLCYIPANSTGYNQPLDVAVFKAFKSSVSWQATSTLAKEIRDTPADLSSVALNIAWKRSSLAEWVYATMREMSTKPALWIHAWRHLTTASEEERKVNVDRAKRAFTDNTLFAPTHHGTVPETAATCEDSMAHEDHHPEIELLHEGETEEAEADGDVEDIVIEVQVQPAASASSSSAAPRKEAQSTRAMHCAQPRLRHGRAQWSVQEIGVLS